jgi:carboxymethylenebutenolidase
MPSGRSGLPVVLVVSEIFGVHEHIADVARRFAHQGYLAIAPELFVRQGDPGSYGDIGKLIAAVVNEARDAQVMADLDACVAWAKAHGGDTRKLGITGFCWGGRIVWMYAAHNPALTAGVAWYGPVARAYSDGDPTAIAAAPRIKAPMLGLYGAADAGIPSETVEQMRAALKAAGNGRSEIVLYPDTPHAFYADYRPSYRKVEADDGWRRCIDWFEANGVA